MRPALARAAAAAPPVAVGAALATPLFLMHGRSIAEVTIAAADLCFLVHCAATREWRWLREGWVPLAIAWWLWVLACTAAMDTRGLGQALVEFRLPLFAAALERFVLRDPAARRWMWRVVGACAAWMLLNAAVQLATGKNLLGFGRGAAGELTGPFDKPRAGPPLGRILLPVLIPPADRLLGRGGWGRPGAYALLLGGTCAMVLMNQRMPLLLFVFGLAIAALLLPRLRLVVIAAAAAGALLVAASAVVSPYTYQRLVLQFSQQMEGFASSHYGLIYARAEEIARQHPLTGLGFDGFRHGCPEPRYFRPSLDGAERDGGGAEICAQHPHNFYLEALDGGGLPGLALFAALALAWLAPLARGLWRDPAPLRVGLFASVLIQLWPLASTSAFATLPMAGWLFLTLGWGLAEARWRPPSRSVPCDDTGPGRL